MTSVVFVGNLDYDVTSRELERLFDKYGKFDQLDVRSGFCYVHFQDRRDAEDCIKDLDRREWGSKNRRLRVEMAKNHDRAAKRKDQAEPNKTLYVSGFNPQEVRTRDLERAFDEFGRLRRCEIKGTYAFIEFETLDSAKAALADMHGAKINGREITVEYVLRDPTTRRRDRDGGRSRRPRSRDRYSRDRRGDRRRSRSRSYERRRRRSPSRSRSRSRSPRRRRSPSPRRSPVARDRSRERSRSPYKSPVRGDGGSPEQKLQGGRSHSRSASPARAPVDMAPEGGNE